MSVRRSAIAVTVVGLTCGAVVGTPVAGADNKRLNDAVVSNVYTVKSQAGCDTDIKVNPKLRLAAEWHANDVLNNRALDGDIGSDGSTVADRARNAGYEGEVAETTAINPALAISGVELMNRWYYRPDYYAIMADCGNVDIGVWSVNALDRTVVVAVYGKGDAAPPVYAPGRPFGTPGAGAPG
ncbi:CAP domain-containing protein [Mycolicibacterium phlei]